MNHRGNKINILNTHTYKYVNNINKINMFKLTIYIYFRLILLMFQKQDQSTKCSQTAMTNAYLAAKTDMSIRRAAQQYGVPFQTLRDRIAGDIDLECCTMGAIPLFSLGEEARFVSHLKEMANIGYGYSRQEVVDVASNFAVHLNKRTRDNPMSLKWFYSFLGRWPELKVIKPRSLEISRAKSATIENVDKYFEELKNVMEKYDLIDKPHLIFNIDEKGITINHSPPRVVTGSEMHPQAVTSGKSSTITILACGNAIGNSIPPYFVFPGARMGDDLLQGSSPGTEGTVSESGWSNSGIFIDYLKSHFTKYVNVQN